MNTLLHLPYSPWSERARWALDVRRVPHRLVTYQPLLGEPRLRVALRRLRGNVSVPVLFTDAPDARVVADSFAIARFADAHGYGPRLFPGDAAGDAAIVRYNEASERALAAGRVLALRRVLASDAALMELVPRALGRPLGRAAIALSRFGIERTLRKYAAADRASADALATLREVLTELRTNLAPSGKTLLGRFSYADITMAQTLVFVSPPETKAGHLRIAPANRAAFTDAALASEFADLVAWRDALYAEHRVPESPQ